MVPGTEGEFSSNSESVWPWEHIGMVRKNMREKPNACEQKNHLRNCYMLNTVAYIEDSTSM